MFLEEVYEGKEEVPSLWGYEDLPLASYEVNAQMVG